MPFRGLPGPGGERATQVARALLRPGQARGRMGWLVERGNGVRDLTWDWGGRVANRWPIAGESLANAGESLANNAGQMLAFQTQR